MSLPWQLRVVPSMSTHNKKGKMMAEIKDELTEPLTKLYDDAFADGARASQQSLSITKAVLKIAEQECAKLRAALEPFAKAADELSSFPDETQLDLAPITLGHLRQARKALAKEEK